MTSIIRISDIPHDELHLLPIIGLRQQIREDQHRLSSPNSRSKAAAREWFVTDWQLQARPIDRVNIDDDEDCDDSEDEHSGKEEENYHTDENHNKGQDFGALYVDIGGEG